MPKVEEAVVGADGELLSSSGDVPVPWWSFTKTLVAAAAMRLAEEGRLSLDRPMAGRRFTLRQLLGNRSGVGNYNALPEYREAVERRDVPWSDEELFRRVPPERLLFEPDAGWSYSNVGYLLARRALEQACGTGLGDILRDRILGPLGLTSSRLAETPQDMLETAFPGGHGYHPGWVFHGVVGGPAAEAALALQRLFAGDLLAPDSRAAMLDRRPVGGAIDGRPWVDTGYGLGLMIGDMTSDGVPERMRVYGHSAGGPGSVGAVYRSDRSGRTVAVFAEGEAEGVAEHRALRSLAWARLSDCT